MGFPTDLRLVSTPEGPRLSFSAVQEIKSLRVRKIARNASGNFNAESGLMDVFLKIRTTNSGALRISANGREVTYDGATHELRCLDKSVRLSPVRGEVELRMLVDRASINIFAQGGLVSMPMFSLQKSELPGTSLSIPDDWNIQREEVYELRSAWK